MLFKEAQGMAVPALGLGTWQMTGSACADAVEAALNMGYRHIDTAEKYGNEAAVGAGLARAEVDRDEVHLTTKVWRTNLAPETVHAAARQSLQRLETEYIDLLLIHWPNETVPVQETLEAMAGLQEAGLVRQVGVSNFTPELLEETEGFDVVCNQVEMHVYHQQEELVRYCSEHDLLLTAYSPLARGRVTEEPMLQDIAEEHDASAAQIALAWLLQHDPVVVIPKAEPPELQEENLAAQEIDLSRGEVERINGIEPREKLVDPDFAPW